MVHKLREQEMQILKDYANPGLVSTRRWRQIWRQRLTVTLLIFSDVLIAILVLEVAALLHGIWGRGGGLSTTAMITTVPAIAVWVGLRALMELYPGYGLDAVQEVRRHAYAVFAV